MAADSQGLSHDTKTLITVILLIFVYPIGVILMWLWMPWKTWIKILVSLPVVIIIIAILSSVFLVALNPRGQLDEANCLYSCSKRYSESASMQKSCSASCVTGMDYKYTDEVRSQIISDCVSGGGSEQACTCVVDHVESKVTWAEFIGKSALSDEEVNTKFDVALEEAAVICE